MNIIENFVYYLKSLKKWYGILFLISLNMGSYFMKFRIYQQLVEFIISVYGLSHIPVNAIFVVLSKLFIQYMTIHISYNVTYYYLEKNVVNYSRKLFGSMVDKMMNYEIDFFKHKTHGKINQLWLYMNSVEMLIEKLILELPRIGAFLIYYVYLVNSCSPHLLYMISLITFIAIYTIHPISKRIQRLQQIRGEIDVNTKNTVLETSSNIEFVKINNKQTYEAEKIKNSYKAYLENKLEDKQLSALLSIASDVYTDLLTFVIFGIGGINIIFGFVRPVELLYLVIHTGNFYYQVVNLKDIYISFNSELPKLKMVYDFIAYDRIEDIDKCIKPSENFDSCENIISFKNVNFSYQPDKPILKNLSFEFKRNKINLLLGPNGSGKSTIIKLLFRLYKFNNQSASIKLYDADINKLSLRELRNNITLVTQEPSMFDGTIWENIVYGCESVDSDYVYKICEMLESKKWLENNKNKRVGFRGKKLTGGEKKKIQIINAVCRSGGILVFDEPSNALDSNGIRWLTDFINKLKVDHGKTVIIASHDLRLVETADHVVEIGKM